MLRGVVFATLALLLMLSSHSYAADVAVPAAELKALVVGKTINSGGGRLYYGRDGTYTYNGQHPGKYAISNGKICVKFNAGQSRCDRIVKNGKRYFLINSGGQRFPFG